MRRLVSSPDAVGNLTFQDTEVLDSRQGIFDESGRT